MSVHKINPQSLLGKNVLQATGELLIHGVQARVVEEDGKSLPLTEDYVANRWDLEVKSGVIVGIRIPSP